MDGGKPLGYYSTPYVNVAHAQPNMFDTLSLSSLSFGTDGDVYVVPTISPIEFIVSPNSIVPPTMYTLKQPKSLIPIGLGTSMLIPSDIFVPSFNVEKSLTSYGDVCDTPGIRETVTKIIYYKFLDKWLYEDHKSKYLLGYLKIIGDTVQLIGNIDEKDDYHKNTQKDVDKKVEYIEDNIISINDVYSILSKFTASTYISWCDVTKNSYFVRDAIEKTLEKKFKRLITEK